MRIAPCVALILVGLAGGSAWPLAHAEEPVAPYNYRDDLPRVALVVQPADGVPLNPAPTGEAWEAPNRIELRKAAGEPVAYTVIPTEADPVRRVVVYDHTGGDPKKAASLAVGTRATAPGAVVELTRGLFGLDNPWCATAVGAHPVTLVKGPGNERPVPVDGCVDLFTP